MIAKVLVAGQLMSRSPSRCRAGASAKDLYFRDKYPVVHTRLARLQFDTPNKVQQRQKDTFFFTASYRYPLLDRQFDICGQSTAAVGSVLWCRPHPRRVLLSKQQVSVESREFSSSASAELSWENFCAISCCSGVVGKSVD